MTNAFFIRYPYPGIIWRLHVGSGIKIFRATCLHNFIAISLVSLLIVRQRGHCFDHVRGFCHAIVFVIIGKQFHLLLAVQMAVVQSYTHTHLLDPICSVFLAICENCVMTHPDGMSFLFVCVCVCAAAACNDLKRIFSQ